MWQPILIAYYMFLSLVAVFNNFFEKIEIYTIFEIFSKEIFFTKNYFFYNRLKIYKARINRTDVSSFDTRKTFISIKGCGTITYWRFHGGERS